jgi:hypothetical protein
MSAHEIIGYTIQAFIGIALLYIGRHLNRAEKRIDEVHVLVNSKMTAALKEISRLNVALDAANAEVGKHDELEV